MLSHRWKPSGLRWEARSCSTPRSQSVKHAAEIAHLKAEVLQLTVSESMLAQQLAHSQSENKSLQAKSDVQSIGMAQKCKALGMCAEKHRAVAERALAAICRFKNTLVFQDLKYDRLIQKTIQLRHSIKAFAQLFIHTSATSQWSPKELRHIATFGHVAVKNGLRVTAATMEAYTWYIIVREAFGKFVWAGQEMDTLQNIWRRSKQAFPKDSQRLNAELLPILCTMHIWRATTASLLLSQNRFPTGQAPPRQEMANTERRQQVRQFIRETCAAAFPTVLFSHIRFDDQYSCQVRIAEIFEQAVKLDAEISSQGARIDWEFNRAGYGVWSNPEVLSDRWMVTAPALLKLGTSNGEDLDKDPEVLLMRDFAVIHTGLLLSVQLTSDNRQVSDALLGWNEQSVVGSLSSHPRPIQLRPDIAMM